MLLAVENLVTEFITRDVRLRAVDSVSFQLERGKTLGIVGESGSGKSVTALSIMRLLSTPPGQISGGHIVFHPSGGKPIDLLQLPAREMRRYRGRHIGMIFQEPMSSLNPVQRCGRQIMEAMLLHRNVTKAEARDATLELLREVSLPRPAEMMNQYPHQLSGGQKQRIMIAMAMSCRPDLLIADEPTTALDVTVQATILDLMRSLREAYNMGMIFITHDLGVVAEIADHIAVMYRGRIVEQGPVLQIFEQPEHPYTRGLLACRPPLGRKLRRLPTVRDFMRGQEDGEYSGQNTANPQEYVKRLELDAAEISTRNAALQSAEPLLRVRDLKVHFGGGRGFGKHSGTVVKAVDGVSFDVFPGETLGLVGESGCGKTTCGRALVRLIEANGGAVCFAGCEVGTMNTLELREFRRAAQIIFQDPYASLNPRLSVGSALLEVLRVHSILASDKERREYVPELLEKVGLRAAHYRNYPHEFSGGQRQRISIARALAVNPRFIICDESVSALDVSVQAQVLNLLVALREEFKLTYIFISHDLSVVKFISDRIAVMESGRIVEMGPAETMYTAPQREYTKRLIAAIPPGTVERIRTRINRSAVPGAHK